MASSPSFQLSVMYTQTYIQVFGLNIIKWRSSTLEDQVFSFCHYKSFQWHLSNESTLQGILVFILSFPGASISKESPCQRRIHKRCWFDACVKKIPGGENCNPLWYSCCKIPWTEDPGRLLSIGSRRVRHDCSDLAHH